MALRDAALEVVREAGRRLVAAQPTAVTVCASDADEVTTSADLESERFIARSLKEIDPAPVISEEADRTGWQGRVRELVVRDEAFWVVDPLDGSASYAEGDHRFGVQLARLQGRQLVGGWIVCPALGWEVACEVGQDPHVHVSARRTAPQRLSDLAAVVASGDFNAGQRDAAAAITAGFRSVRPTRSCAVDYAEIAAGLIDLAIFKRTLPWDHAPGVFVAEHLGLRSLSFDGSAYRVERVDGGLVVSGGARQLPSFPDVTTLDCGPA